MLKDDISNAFNFQQHLLFANSSNHRENSGTHMCNHMWKCYELRVVDKFCYKKSSSAQLVLEQQASLQ